MDLINENDLFNIRTKPGKFPAMLGARKSLGFDLVLDTLFPGSTLPVPHAQSFSVPSLALKASQWVSLLRASLLLGTPFSSPSKSLIFLNVTGQRSTFKNNLQ